MYIPNNVLMVYLCWTLHERASQSNKDYRDHNFSRVCQYISTQAITAMV